MGRKRGGNFTECLGHKFFEGDFRLFAHSERRTILVLQSACGKDGAGEASRKCPGFAGCGEFGELRAYAAEQTTEGDCWKKVGFSDAHVGIGGNEILFRFAQIWTALQQCCGESRGNFWRVKLLRERGAPRS